MKRASFFALNMFISVCAIAQTDAVTPDSIVRVSENSEPMATGKYEPTWESLRQYETPEWFRNAKFGIRRGFTRV